MLWGLIALLAILWVVGLVTKVVAGGLIHLLIIAAVVLALFRLFTGRRAT
jgi:Family of unknown function (DUF5670)